MLRVIVSPTEMEFSKQRRLDLCHWNIERQGRLQEWFEPAAQWHHQGQRSFLSLTPSAEYQLHPQTSLPPGMGCQLHLGIHTSTFTSNEGESREVYPGFQIGSTKIHPGGFRQRLTPAPSLEAGKMPFSELNKCPPPPPLRLQGGSISPKS